MTRGRTIILVLSVAALGVAGWLAYGYSRALAHTREAYAAWDTGTLLVEYMRRHDDRWPSSWDDLLTVLDSDAGRQIPLRGAQAGDLPYARSLRETVAVDWSFNPSMPAGKRPVTQHDGAAFPVVWEGAEPNEMIHAYLNETASTGPTTSR